MPRAETINTRRLISVADLNTDIDNEPRVQDVCLATALGYARHYKIRELIVRNEAELNTYGSLPLRRGSREARHSPNIS